MTTRTTARQRILHVTAGSFGSAMNDAIMADAGEVVRTVSSDKILAHMGIIFSVPDLVTPRTFLEVSEEDRAYNLSKPAESIDYFVSHSWRTSCLEKANAMAIFLHTRLAILTTLSTLFVLSKTIGHRFSLTGTMCMTKTHMDWLMDCLWAGSIPIITGSVTILFVRFGQYLPCMSVDCFLDKACIHQGNHKLKLQAVQCLDIMLLYSHRMLVLWAPDYFDRLWCVYELATFMKLHPNASSRLNILPTWMPTFITLSFLSMTCTMTLVGITSTGPFLAWGIKVAGPLWGYALVHKLAVLAPLTLMGFACYWKVSQHMLMMKQLRSFQVEKAMCAEPSDKVFILSVIDVMWSSSHESHDGKENFEHYIRTKLPEQLEDVIGMRACIPYYVTMVAYLPMISVHFMFGMLCDQHMVKAWGYSSAYSDPQDRFAAFFSGWLLYCVMNFCFCNPSANVLAQVVCARAMDARWRPCACAALTIVTYAIVLCTLIDLIVVFVMLDPTGADVRTRRFGLFAVLGAITYTCWHLPKRMVQ